MRIKGSTLNQQLAAVGCGNGRPSSRWHSHRFLFRIQAAGMEQTRHQVGWYPPGESSQVTWDRVSVGCDQNVKHLQLKKKGRSKVIGANIGQGRVNVAGLHIWYLRNEGMLSEMGHWS